MLLNYHIGHFVLVSLCVGDLVWLGLSSIRVAGLKNKRPTLCHLLFYFTSYVLNMFRTLIYTSSGACDYAVELPHWSSITLIVAPCIFLRFIY